MYFVTIPLLPLIEELCRRNVSNLHLGQGLVQRKKILHYPMLPLKVKLAHRRDFLIVNIIFAGDDGLMMENDDVNTKPPMHHTDSEEQSSVTSV